LAQVAMVELDHLQLQQLLVLILFLQLLPQQVVVQGELKEQHHMRQLQEVLEEEVLTVHLVHLQVQLDKETMVVQVMGGVLVEVAVLGQ
jgi:hypothetical protein